MPRITGGNAAVKEPIAEVMHPSCNVVAHESHSFDPVDAAFGRLIGIPVLEPGFGHGVDAGLAPKCHHDVDIANQLRVNEFGRL